MVAGPTRAMAAPSYARPANLTARRRPTSSFGPWLATLATQALPEDAVDQFGIGPAARLLHHLTHQEGERFVFPPAELLCRIRIRRDDLLNQPFQVGGVADLLQTAGRHQRRRISPVADQRPDRQGPAARPP